MEPHTLITSVALIFSSAAILATLALYARQSLIVAYIVLGFALGPAGLRWIDQPVLIRQIADIGIVFLLFLLGLNLVPQKLVDMLRDAFRITFFSSAAFFAVAAAIAFAFGFTWLECAVIGACMSLSSTIIGLKLLPTSDLYRARPGEIIISVLLLQDILAIVVLLIIQGYADERVPFEDFGILLLSLPGLVVAAFLIEMFVVDVLLRRFNAVQEYVFLVALGWCLGMAELAERFGLSAEIGAFIAGVAMASSPAARYISRRLKPLRDFFLILFFFAIGAGLSREVFTNAWLPGLLLAVTMLAMKPAVFAVLLRQGREDPAVSSEVGIRLGQASEFSLLIGSLAYLSLVISEHANNVIQVATVLTFIASSFFINRTLPTPTAPPRTWSGPDQDAR